MPNPPLQYESILFSLTHVCIEWGLKIVLWSSESSDTFENSIKVNHQFKNHLIVSCRRSSHKHFSFEMKSHIFKKVSFC